MERIFVSAHRALSRHHLESFALTRAPLLRDPRAAVLRAAGLGAAALLMQSARDEEVRAMAARTYEAHTRDAPSKCRASRREFAAASAMLADVGCIVADSLHGEMALEFLCGYLASFDEERGLDAELRWYGRALILLQAMTCEHERVRLGAARTLLVWTRQAARRVGYGAHDDAASPESANADAFVNVNVNESRASDHVHESPDPPRGGAPP